MSYYDILLAKQLSGGGGDITVESLSVTANGTYTAPSGKAYTPVTVNVPNSYTASDEGKVVSSGALVAQTSQTIDTNGTYDTTLKNSVTVNVSGGGGDAIKSIIDRTVTTYEIPQGVTVIGYSAFQHCKSLTTITIPTGVTTLEGNCFYECTDLHDVVIPASVTEISNAAFRYDTNLATITLYATTPPTLGVNVFSNISTLVIYVPSESVEAYKAATNWSSYASKIQAIPS